jgi:hypothetical protein
MHKSRPIQFALCVDDFGVKYVNKEDVEHLKSALTAVNPETNKPMFEISEDINGTTLQTRNTDMGSDMT